MIESVAFLDTNFFARFLLADNESHSPIAREGFRRIIAGEIAAETSETVIFELVYLLEKGRNMPRPMIGEILMRLTTIRNLHIPNASQIEQAVEVWVDTRALSFADAFHLALAAATPHRRIASFDRAMGNRVAGVVRIEKLP